MLSVVQNQFPQALTLPTYLDRVDKGRETDYRSPLYGRSTPREEIARLFEEIAFDESLSPEMHAIESKERGKIGPYSVMVPFSHRRASVEQYFRPTKHHYDRNALMQAAAFITKYIRASARLKPKSLDSVFESSTKTSNWGLPLFESGKKSGEFHLQIARDALQTGKFPYYPSVLGWRGQPNGTDTPKQRTVWMYPHYVVLLELMYQTSFLSFAKRQFTFAAWNDEQVIDQAVTDMLRRDGLKVSFDAKAFDMNTIRILIDLAFDILGKCFQQQYRDLLLGPIASYFTESGIVTPIGTIEGRTAKVPSGSGLTNLIDCLVQLIIAAYVCIRSGGVDNLSTFSAIVLGDDGIWNWKGIEPKDVTGYAAELGVDASLDKNYSDYRKCQFLQKLHDLDFLVDDLAVGIRSIFRTVNGMMSYERLVRGWSEYMDSIRWIMQLEQCTGHPKHPELVRLVMRGDKLQLGRVLKGGVKELTSLAGGAANISKVLRIESFPFGKRNPRGIMSFATTRVVMQGK